MSKSSLFRFIVSTGLLLLAVWYVYANYYETIYDWFGIRTEYPLFIEEAYFTVTIADEPDEWRQGLSGTDELADQTGLLFVFDELGAHGIWMKDMEYALDVLWLNEQFEIVHIAENITPASYPTVYRSDEPARFVLEVPAFTVRSFQITEGQRATLPTDVLPRDLQKI